MFAKDFKNRSKIVIEIGTKFSKQIYKENNENEDITLEVEKSFHDAVLKHIENHITDDPDFENEILEIMGDDGDLIEDTDEFSKLGEIGISLSQTEKNITKEKQAELTALTGDSK